MGWSGKTCTSLLAMLKYFSSGETGANPVRVRHREKEINKMQKKQFQKVLSYILSIVLIVAMALCTTGCKDNTSKNTPQEEGTAVITDGAVLGEGSTSFQFAVVDGEGKEISCTINTDEKLVGAALQALDILQGEAGPYGLYVKTVNGLTVDYDKDGKYWAFYVNGEYGMTGVDVTEIEAGASYAFKVE